MRREYSDILREQEEMGLLCASEDPPDIRAVVRKTAESLPDADAGTIAVRVMQHYQGKCRPRSIFRYLWQMKRA